MDYIFIFLYATLMKLYLYKFIKQSKNLYIYKISTMFVVFIGTIY